MKIPIALITDENFAPYCATTMASVLRNAGKDTELSFYILTEGLSQTVKDKFNELRAIKECSIDYILINKDDFRGLPKCHHIPVESYYRFKLFSSLPDLDKVLYLDSDMVVLGDVGEIFNINIDNYYAGMVIDAVKNLGTIISDAKIKLQMPIESEYFNAGVMLVNLAKCREYNIGQQLFEWAKNNISKLTWADQDVINVVMNGYIKELPEKYNVQLSYRTTNVRLSELDEIKVIHYCGSYKPWNMRGMFLSEHFWDNYYPFMTVYQ